LNDEEMLIDECQADLGRGHGGSRGMLEYFEYVAFSDTPLRVEAQIAVDLNAAAADELANLSPGAPFQMVFEGSGEGLATEAWRYVKHLRGHSSIVCRLRTVRYVDFEKRSKIAF
jgi:hypothetical protein